MTIEQTQTATVTSMFTSVTTATMTQMQTQTNTDFETATETDTATATMLETMVCVYSAQCHFLFQHMSNIFNSGKLLPVTTPGKVSGRR